MMDKMNGVSKDIADLREEMRQGYVTKDEFGPVQKIVYSAAGLILTSVLGALVYLVVQKPS